MTRKLTRSVSALRGIAPFIAVLTVMIALAALAQTRGAGQAFGKSHTAPMLGSAVPSDAGPLDSGTPLFLPAVEYDSYFGSGTDSIAVGDLNGDGNPDLLVGNHSCTPNCLVGTAKVLLGVGDGTFQEKGSYGTAGVIANVALADVNGDGKLDMLASGCAYKDCFTGVVTVHTGNGDGTFAGGFYVFGTGGMFPSSPAVADFNGDGKLDLVVSNCGNGCNTGTGTVGVLLGNGDATFQTVVTYGSGGVGANKVVVADVNGDGKPDLIVPNSCASSGSCPIGPGSVGVLLGKGDGTFQAAVTYGSGGDYAFSVAVADINGDGKLDVLVANSCGNSNCSTPGPLGVLLGNGDGTFQPVIPYNSGTYLGRIALADVNGDGKLDVVTTSGSVDVMVLLGNGDGTFQAPVFIYGTGGFGANGLAVADVNGDGRPDLMVTNLCFNANPNCPHGSVGVLLNDTGPHSPTTTSLVSNVNPAAVNQQVIYTATVTNQSGGQLTGTVAFKHNTSTTTVKLVGDQAVYKATYSGSGTHPITATYSGDADNATSTSATLTEYVGLAPTTTTLTTSGSPSHVGQPVTFTATVKWTYGTVPDGELVTFFDGTATIGTGTTASGIATFTTSSLTVKTHTIKATYSGDAKFKPSSGKVIQVVQ
jgi:hypothetical protein